MALISIPNLKSKGNPINLLSCRLYKLLIEDIQELEDVNDFKNKSLNKHKLKRSEYYYSPQDISSMLKILQINREFLSLKVQWDLEEWLYKTRKYKADNTYVDSTVKPCIWWWGLNSKFSNVTCKEWKNHKHVKVIAPIHKKWIDTVRISLTIYSWLMVIC